MMNLDVIAQEVQTELTKCSSNGMTGDINNLAIISQFMIKEHITSHTLNPMIRIGIMLQLLDLDDKMKNDLYKVDAQGQCLGLDPKMIDAINLYKSNPAKLPFNKSNAYQQNTTN